MKTRFAHLLASLLSFSWSPEHRQRLHRHRIPALRVLWQ